MVDGFDVADEARFVRRCLIVLAIVVGALAAYQLLEVLLLAFGAVLVAVIFRAGARPLIQHLHLPAKIALAITILATLSLLGVVMWFFGNQIGTQAQGLIETVPEAWRSLEQRVRDTALGEQLMEIFDTAPSGREMAPFVGRLLGSAGSAMVEAVVVVIAGIYIAYNPRLYRGGFAKLFPTRRQEQVRSTFEASAQALRLWLFGQLIAMLLVGLLTWIGLWIVGVPSALALGVLAGLAEFVPVIGPFLSAIPGLLLALALGPEYALGALLVYLLVQQLESNFITPLINRRMVSLPPAVTLFALLALGVMFGAVGVILAAPLSVVIYVAVKKLYVKQTLQHETAVPGEDDAPKS
ncbi:MAG: AI-2E family transporter [Pseudomonadota bacterium]|nr:AI-2E family transporter [Pseudomonadota bacterium]